MMRQALQGTPTGKEKKNLKYREISNTNDGSFYRKDFYLCSLSRKAWIVNA